MMTFLKSQKAAIAGVVSLISLTAFPLAAFAGDAKVYSGSQCFLAGPTSSNVASLSLFGGQVINRGTATVEVICPIIRDVTQGTENGSTGPLAVVHVFSNNAATTTVECDLRAFEVNKLGPTVGRFQRLTKVLSGGVVGTPAKHAFNFNGPIQQTSGGAYDIRCTLPVGTGVGNYTVTE